MGWITQIVYHGLDNTDCMLKVG